MKCLKAHPLQTRLGRSSTQRSQGSNQGVCNKQAKPCASAHALQPERPGRRQAHADLGMVKTCWQWRGHRGEKGFRIRAGSAPTTGSFLLVRRQAFAHGVSFSREEGSHLGRQAVPGRRPRCSRQTQEGVKELGSEGYRDRLPWERTRRRPTSLVRRRIVRSARPSAKRSGGAFGPSGSGAQYAARADRATCESGGVNESCAPWAWQPCPACHRLEGLRSVRCSVFPQKSLVTWQCA